jgi:hypothetical protein
MTDSRNVDQRRTLHVYPEGFSAPPPIRTINSRGEHVIRFVRALIRGERKYHARGRHP